MIVWPLVTIWCGDHDTCTANFAAPIIAARRVPPRLANLFKLTMALICYYLAQVVLLLEPWLEGRFEKWSATTAA